MQRWEEGEEVEVDVGGGGRRAAGGRGMFGSGVSSASRASAYLSTAPTRRFWLASESGLE